MPIRLAPTLPMGRPFVPMWPAYPGGSAVGGRGQPDRHAWRSRGRKDADNDLRFKADCRITCKLREERRDSDHRRRHEVIPAFCVSYAFSKSSFSRNGFGGRNRINSFWAGTQVKVKELIKLLKDDGWFLVRTRGSHRQFHHPTKPGTVTVAGKLSVDIPPGTLNNALKQAGLKD